MTVFHMTKISIKQENDFFKITQYLCFLKYQILFGKYSYIYQES